MGIFDKIGEIFGDIVDGIVDFVDDVFNIDLAKVLSNDVVRYGLMAVSLFTGGVAIVNGAIKGAAQFGASQAKGFIGKFVEGAGAFMKGVGQGLASPIQTAKNIPGEFAGLTGQSGAGNQLASAVSSSDSVAQEALQQMADPSAAAPSSAPWTEADQAFADIAQPDFSLQSAAQSDPVVQSASKAAQMDPSQQAMTNLGANVPDINLGQQVAQSGATTAAPEPSFMRQMLDGARGFASSPAGMQTLAGMAQGWAQGEMIQEKWDNMIREDRRREASWTGNTPSTPRVRPIPSLQELRDQIIQRGNAANARYGY